MSVESFIIERVFMDMGVCMGVGEFWLWGIYWGIYGCGAFIFVVFIGLGIESQGRNYKC